jgi:hypothetical protein
MDNQKNSPLTSILSPRRGEADRERRYDSILSGQRSPLLFGKRRGEGEELIEI